MLLVDFSKIIHYSSPIVNNLISKFVKVNTSFKIIYSKKYSSVGVILIFIFIILGASPD